MKYPIRINKYLAMKNICSRREADDLIKAGKVKINGKKAECGMMVSDGDEVTARTSKKCVYYAFNKPAGIITHSPQKGEQSICDIAKFPVKVFPLGRLDKDSNGLILLSNDGRITDKLLNPDYEHEKEYIVKVDNPITDKFIKKMSSGIELDDDYKKYKTKKCSVERKNADTFSIILTEGKKRQIRKMCGSLGYGVVDLQRIRIMNIYLGNLKIGKYREIEGGELEELKKLLRM